MPLWHQFFIPTGYALDQTLFDSLLVVLEANVADTKTRQFRLVRWVFRDSVHFQRQLKYRSDERNALGDE
jgi:hypothetical protein